MNLQLIFLAAAWVVYFALHSILAALTVKEYCQRHLSIGRRFYRLLYVAFSTLGLLAILLYALLIPSQRLFGTHNDAAKYVGLLLAGWGVFGIMAGFKSYDIKAFLGLGNMASEDELKTDGLLKKVRHPVYAGSILVVVGYFIYIPTIVNLVSTTLIVLYILIGIYLEEQKLLKAFGERYREYRKKTPMLIPRFFK